MDSTFTLELLSSTILHVTLEQFEAILLTQRCANAAANRDLRLERTCVGELIVNPPTGGESSQRNFNILGQLSNWLEANPDLGEGFDSSTGFILPNGAIRSPDASWVQRQRWQALTASQRRGFVTLCPDFVVELSSASDSLVKLQEKMQEYLENGAKLGWLISPQTQQVEIYHPGQTVEVLEHPTELSGENVLPEFILNLKRIWR